MSDSAPVSRSAQRHLDLIRYRAETLALHQDNPAVAEWLGQFRDNGQHFLERYAGERASALVDGRTFFDIAQREEAQLVQEATERLWEIQQRKLFELQCRWRAEEVRLPAGHIELSHDFERWGSRIERCPLVPPIAAAEVDDYVAFLLSNDCTDATDPLARPREWQNYNRCRRYLLLQAEGQSPQQVQRDAIQNPGQGLGGLVAMLDDFFLNYPDWYAYRDAQAGPPNLVLYLPDHRGEKEEHYRHLGLTGKLPDPYALDDDDEDDEPTPPPTAPPGPDDAPVLEHLGYQQFLALTDTLMRELEPPELLRFHEALTQEPEFAAVPPPEQDEDDEDDDDDEDEDDRESRLAEMGQEAGRVLLEIPERLPIVAWPDWRLALHHTWETWRKERLATALRAAYAAYQERERAGQRHPSSYKNDAKLRPVFKETRAQVRQLILKGRAVAGEPQDLNF